MSPGSKEVTIIKALHKVLAELVLDNRYGALRVMVWFSFFFFLLLSCHGGTGGDGCHDDGGGCRLLNT